MDRIPFPPGCKIFAYLRDSGHDDQDASIQQQEVEVTQWALANGLILTNIFKDEARRGSSIVGREQLEAMMHRFRMGCPEAGVVVWRYNRFARNIDNAQYYRSEIRSRGYIFFSLKDKVPPGREGRLFEAVIDYTDEGALETMSEDIKRALVHNARVHKTVPGTPPRGFTRERIVIGRRRDGSERIGHKWIPDPETAPLVLKAFQMRAAGLSLNQINDQVHFYREKSGWRTFFANKIYIGILVYGDEAIEDYCEPIVPIDIWNAVQERQGYFKKSKHVKSDRLHPRRVDSRFLLSGLTRCLLCDKPLAGHTSTQKSKKRVDSYLCPGARNHTCEARRIPTAALETVVIEKLAEFLAHPEVMMDVQEKNQKIEKEKANADKKELAHLDRILAKQRVRIDNITSAIADHGKSRSLLQSLDELEAEETRILTEIEQTKNRIARSQITLSPQDLSRRSTTIVEVITTGTFEQKRTILRAIIDGIIVHRNENTLRGEIYFRTPPETSFSPDTDNVPIVHTPPGAPIVYKSA